MKQPLFYFRYIDDIIGIWEHTEEELNEYVRVANSIHQNISLTLRASRNQIEFLDVMLKIDSQNILSTTLFEKPSNAFLYLHNSSNHPNHTKKKIAYGLALRAKKICS